MTMAQVVKVGYSWKLEELGLDRRARTDQAVFAFARYAEARIAKWVQFPKGVLLFLMVPGDPESGGFYLLDRAKGTFYSLDLTGDRRWGGDREGEFGEQSGKAGFVRAAEGDPAWG